MNLESMKPPAAQFFEHALRNAERPPFRETRSAECGSRNEARPRLSRRPRCQQRPDYFPVVIPSPDLKASSSNQ
jgi:hypothetical protein